VGKSGHCCDHCSNSSGRLGLRRSDLVSICFTRRSFTGPRRDDLANYWAHGPFVRSFILLVDPGDIRPHTIGLSGGVPSDCPVSQRGNGYLRATVDSDSATLSRQKSEEQVRGAPDCPVHHQTVRYHKKTKAPMVIYSRTLTVG
jgi:hypothetical protein